MATLEGVNKKYFHISTRSWRLLADFIFDRCDDLIKDDERHGWHSNYGKIISAETAKQIADRLEKLIAEGVVDRHLMELSIIKMEFYFTKENLRKFIEFSKYSGGFDIW